VMNTFKQNPSRAVMRLLAHTFYRAGGYGQLGKVKGG